MHARKLHVALFVWTIFLAGCSTTAATTKIDTQDGASARPGMGERVSLLDDEERTAVFMAEQTLVSRCMAQRGFKFSAIKIPQVDSAKPSYGNDDIEWAKKNGLANPDPSMKITDDFVRNHPNQKEYDALTPAQKAAWNRALGGTPDSQLRIQLTNGREMSINQNGCVAEAQEELYGGIREWLTLEESLFDVERVVNRGIRADQRYIEALNQWRSCMRSQGYHYSDPLSARSQFFKARAADPGSASFSRQSELKLAVADAQCARDAKLITIAQELDRSYRDAALRSKERDILAYREVQAAALEKAKQLLKS